VQQLWQTGFFGNPSRLTDGRKATLSEASTTALAAGRYARLLPFVRIFPEFESITTVTNVTLALSVERKPTFPIRHKAVCDGS